MCILLWTLPDSNHPRFKFAFASNRDEFMARKASRAAFWDLNSILKRASLPSESLAGSPEAPSFGLQSNDTAVGILSGQDLQPSQAENYTIKETEMDAVTEEERITMTLLTNDVPGTWLGITTHGDLVALTNYRETMAYMAQTRGPKLSRGKVCGEYLITMAAAHFGSNSDLSKNGSLAEDRAEQWIRKRGVGWEDEFEGLNLLVVQNSGDQQCVGGNREGSGLSIFKKKQNTANENEAAARNKRVISPGSVVGVSNSVFSRPWTKVEIGVGALEKVLNDSLTLFGTGRHASFQSQSRVDSQPTSPATPGPIVDGQPLDDDTKELAWLVVEMLTLLRVNTKPYPKEGLELLSALMGLRERVFIPRITMGSEYGTRSSTVVLFGRDSRLAVYVEKIWYGPIDETTGERVEFAADSAEGLIWWQGYVGQPKEEWKCIEGQELENLIRIAKGVQQVKMHS
ncbi:hypothetical protein BC939DRAFT_467155 [Gamsiella multidivaricata]|uniref:uncharacterized protein n=1 Tax=Gamsiella multidivaricata TaxID=101098 RepID=UPI00221F7299|nr:uncharacterized protein BC939DRAFT_467155 [Gamsiella multidivaricata]KAI7817021.1 hypothetical protein BC939DRAFT_467155 [Gamsiella multidivaricata]